MGVVLGESTHAHHSVQHAAALVSIDGPELRIADRQIAVRALVRLVDADVSGAIHRLGAIGRALYVHRAEHVLPEILQVSRHLKQLLADDVRREHEVVAVPQDQRALVLLDLVSDDGALGMPKYEAWPDARICRVEIELLGENPMIATLGLLQPMQVLLEIFLFPEGGAVDALQHLAMLVTSPICAGGVQQLEVLEI